MRRVILALSLVGVGAWLVLAQTTNDPFPAPIEATQGVVRVDAAEFASLPDIDGQAARMMILVDEPGTKRLFVNDMRGPIYTVGYDGRAVARYMDVNDPKLGVPVNATGRERGVQSFAMHPQFGQAGTPGYGRLYALADTTDMQPAADFRAEGATKPTHHTVLLEWTAKNPAAAAYDGGPARELIRWEQPFANHNGGHITFNPLAAPGTPEYGLLYMGFADGGSGGDPLNLSQNLGSAFGKILRIDPLGTNSANKKYGIPATNPFAADDNQATLGEIYALGVRNPQRLVWDPKTGMLYVGDIGQNTVEEISPVPAGGNLGWNRWEGSFAYVSRDGVDASKRRADPAMTYPVVEYAQPDPLLQGSSAATMGVVYRHTRVPQLANLLIFADLPSGEIFYVNADKPPAGGQDAIRRILINHDGAAKTLLQVIQDKNAAQGKKPATRVDLRFGYGPDGRVFLLNKGDGVIREIVPSRS